MRNHWLRKSWKLEIREVETDTDSFAAQNIEVRKGPYKMTFSSDSMQDILDCNGLTVEGEMKAIICMALEGRKYRSFDEPPNVKKQEITECERRRLLVVLHQIRHGKPYRHLLD